MMHAVLAEQLFHLNEDHCENTNEACWKTVTRDKKEFVENMTVLLKFARQDSLKQNITLWILQLSSYHELYSQLYQLSLIMKSRKTTTGSLWVVSRQG